MTTVTPEIEAVAKAMVHSQMPPDYPEVGNWDTISDHTKQTYLQLARAALLAIREPTDEMLEAMSRTHHANTTTRWNIAIDHILGVKP